MNECHVSRVEVLHKTTLRSKRSMPMGSRWFINGAELPNISSIEVNWPTVTHALSADYDPLGPFTITVTFTSTRLTFGSPEIHIDQPATLAFQKERNT